MPQKLFLPHFKFKTILQQLFHPVLNYFHTVSNYFHPILNLKPYPNNYFHLVFSQRIVQLKPISYRYLHTIDEVCSIIIDNNQINYTIWLAPNEPTI